MTEDTHRQWVAGQLKDRTRDRHEKLRRERATAVRATRNVADRCLAGGRIDREALRRAQEDGDDMAF